MQYLVHAKKLTRSQLSLLHKRTTETRMWANTQRDGRPAEYIGGALCSTPQSLADAQYWSAVQ